MPLEKTAKDYFFIKPIKEKQFHLSFFSVIAIGLLFGSFALLHISSAVGYYFVKALQLLLFFVAGNHFISVPPNFLTLHFPVNAENKILRFAFSLCMSLIVFYLFLKKAVWLMAFSSTAAFLLPYILKLCWHLFNSIPIKEFNAWTPKAMMPGRTAVSLDSVLIRLKFTQHVSDANEKIYTVFVLRYTKLGDFFSRFLAQYNAHVGSAIESTDEKGNKYAWEFFTTGFFSSPTRRLDPDLTIIDNKLRKHAVIYIKRFIQPG